MRSPVSGCRSSMSKMVSGSRDNLMYAMGLQNYCYGLEAYKTQGQLLPHRLTPSGLLFAAVSPEAPSFEDHFPGLEDLLSQVDFTKLPFKRTLSYEGHFNWKTM